LPGKLKEDNIRLGIKKWDFDIFGIAEINLDWRVLNEQERLPHRTKEWWEHQHISWAHNRNLPPRQAREYGGTALFSVNKAALRVIGKGQDQTNLGRWSWTRYKGKGNHTLRILVAYRPNPPQGPFTVYAQHNSFFHTIARDIWHLLMYLLLHALTCMVNISSQSIFRSLMPLDTICPAKSQATLTPPLQRP